MLSVCLKSLVKQESFVVTMFCWSNVVMHKPFFALIIIILMSSEPKNFTVYSMCLDYMCIWNRRILTGVVIIICTYVFYYDLQCVCNMVCSFQVILSKIILLLFVGVFLCVCVCVV